MSEPMSYTAGDWFGIVGPAATVLLPPSEKNRAGALWNIVDDGAGFDEVLDALVAEGLRSLPGFVLIATAAEDGVTKVVVRGDTVARFQAAGGEVEVDGSTSATWAERSLSSVTGFSVEMMPAEGETYVLSGGLARVGSVVVPATPVAAEDRSAEGAPAPAVAAPVVAPVPTPVETEADSDDAMTPPAGDDPAVAEVPAAAGAHALAGEDVDGPVDLADADTGTAPEPAPADEAGADTASEQDADAVTEAMPATGPQASAAASEEEPLPEPPAAPAPEVEASPEAAASPMPPSGPPSTPPPAAPPNLPPPPPAAAPTPEAPGEVDHDGLTRAGAPAPDLARQQPGIPGQPSAPNVTAFAVARLEFSSGDVVDVDRVVLVGRAPEAGRFTQNEQPLMVTVPSPNQEISSTHCEVRPGTGVDHGAAVVTDLGSTNGTVLVQPGLGPEELRPGVPVQLIPGAVIDLGDGLTIRATTP